MSPKSFKITVRVRKADEKVCHCQMEGHCCRSPRGYGVRGSGQYRCPSDLSPSSKESLKARGRGVQNDMLSQS